MTSRDAIAFLPLEPHPPFTTIDNRLEPQSDAYKIDFLLHLDDGSISIESNATASLRSSLLILNDFGE